MVEADRVPAERAVSKAREGGKLSTTSLGPEVQPNLTPYNAVWYSLVFFLTPLSHPPTTPQANESKEKIAKGR
ncbi:hypothetical protein J6590_039716 [Homalodisca vitripennis]|nr:hypothetical protein J6590_039716 [Homalodisca vitripennis]